MTTTTALHRLNDTGQTVARRSEDVRGWNVVDSEGEVIGTVVHLFVDDQEHKVRFLEVTSGGFVGLGKMHALIPVEAITQIAEETVYVDQTRDHIAGAPRYDPELATARTWTDLYGYYGYGPDW